MVLRICAYGKFHRLSIYSIPVIEKHQLIRDLAQTQLSVCFRIPHILLSLLPCRIGTLRKIRTLILRFWRPVFSLLNYQGIWYLAVYPGIEPGSSA